MSKPLVVLVRACAYTTVQVFIDAANLTKVGGVAHHVDIEELGHVSRASIIVLSLERRSDVGTLLRD